MSELTSENAQPNPASNNEPIPPVEVQESEGPRAERLRAIFNTALTHSLKTCSYPNFSRCFPTPAERAPEALKSIWTQMCGFWEAQAKREWELILKERNVVSGLNQLDILTKEAEERKASAPPGELPISPSTLSPDVILTAQLTPLLIAAQQQVSSRISEVQVQNTNLMSTIEDQRREIEELLKVLENNLGHLESAVEVINEGKKAGDYGILGDLCTSGGDEYSGTLSANQELLDVNRPLVNDNNG